MRICCFSDPHGNYRELSFPEADMLICSGDFTGYGTALETVRFFNFIKELDYKYKILVPGNHDLDIDSNPYFYEQSLDKDMHLLINKGVTIKGISIYGSPFTPTFGDWVFMRDRGEDIKEIWDRIPDKIDILVTHGPPSKILDKTIRGEEVGCFDLKKAIERVKPKYHIFGHIHHSHGVKQIGDTTYINCSVLDDWYNFYHEPIVFDY
jgi:Icc-related predicted phosphoesterase